MFNAYDFDVWEHSFFDENTGGYVVTEIQRITQSEKSKSERGKYRKEYNMCVALAMDGNAVEHLDDKHGNSYDIHLNGVKADLKKTGSHNNIRNYAKEALNKQGASIVVFEFKVETEEIHSEILLLQKKGIHGKYYFSKNKKIIFNF